MLALAAALSMALAFSFTAALPATVLLLVARDLGVR
jgi:hypothetical protein